jgi:hypothetical protein
VRLLRKKARRRAFIDLRPIDIGVQAPGAAPLFLGRFDEDALRHELDEAGVFAGLARRGYHDVVLRLERVEREHRLLLLPRRARVSLIDLRLAEATLLLRELTAGSGDDRVVSVLAIHWLSMQDPRAPFTKARPRLPGQRHPGLGLGRELMLRIHQWAASWGKDALVNFPEYYHNAVFYSELYRFASPPREGRFQALRRDLAALSVAEASRAVDEGRVREGLKRRPFVWETGEMLAPLSDHVRAYLESDAYRDGVAAARAASRFRLRDAVFKRRA